MIYTYNYIGIVTINLSVKAYRALDLVDAFSFQHSSRVEVDILKSRPNVVFGTLSFGSDLVLSVIGVRHKYITGVFASKVVANLIGYVLAD